MKGPELKRGDGLMTGDIAKSTMPAPSAMKPRLHPLQISVLGSAEPGSLAYERAGEAGEALARRGITLVSGCGSPATRVAAERALAAGGQVISVIPTDDIATQDWPCTALIPCGMGDARNLIMALAGDACIVFGGRAGTISEVCLAWLHRRPLLPLTGCGGWSDTLVQNPPDERELAPILGWSNVEELLDRIREITGEQELGRP